MVELIFDLFTSSYYKVLLLFYNYKNSCFRYITAFNRYKGMTEKANQRCLIHFTIKQEEVFIDLPLNF